MNYTGKLYYEHINEPSGTVTSGILTKNSVSLDWVTEGLHGHLNAEIVDGTPFEGRYNYVGTPAYDGQFRMKLYRSGRDAILFGSYVRNSKEREGNWLFVLRPCDASEQ